MLGLIAATCTTASFFPQAIQVYQTKNTRDLSLLTYTILTIGILLWLIYGILISDTPLIIANGISFLLSFFIVVMKIRYK